MSVIQCPKCGKPNNEALTACVYCNVNLKSGVDLSSSPESLYIAEEDNYYQLKFHMMRQF